MRTKVIFLIYRAAWLAAFPCLLLYVLWRVVRDRGYLRGLSERLGFWTLDYRTPPGSVWLHAVSVGEVLSAVEIIRRMRGELPHTPIYISCSTIAGREVADAKLTTVADGVFYAPIDTCWAVRRVLRRIRPAVLVVLETEIWPNLYRETKRSGASVVIVNGRIGDKTAERYRQYRWLFATVFDHVDAVLAQSAQDEARYVAAGASPTRVRVAGNLKYDFQPTSGTAPADVLSALRRPLWIAASTSGPMHPQDIDEDDAILSAFIQVRATEPNLQLVIAPRKPDRFDAVEVKIRATGIDYARRSALTDGSPSIVLLDSVGELSSLFPHADFVFMGGTMAERGGHNILEPALCGKPVIAGPHLENFAAIRDRFLAASGYIAISGPEQLQEAVESLLRNPGMRESLGARARALAESERGATSRALRIIAERRWEYVPRALPWGIARPALWLLSRIWIVGGLLKRRIVTKRALTTHVISVGGIAMGGVGKTPMVQYLAELLAARGYKPAVLTRGYGRQASEEMCLAKGSQIPASLTGDEPQLLLRSANVGIGANRWSVGKQMEQKFHPDLFLLDDGFQHGALHRNIDIVLLDGIDPLGGDAVFPLGRLREPLKETARANVVVITRAGDRRFDGLLRRMPQVPIFLADVEVRRWLPERPPLDSIAVFCGLANPYTFYETLRNAGVNIALSKTFPDHHRYTRSELTKFARRAESLGVRAIVTTEKDFENLPEDAAAIVAPLKLCRVEIRLRVRNETTFLAQIDLLMGLSSRFNGGYASL